MQSIQEILSSKTLHIKALTSAGIISGIVTDIFSSCSSKEKNLLEELLDHLSKTETVNISQNNLTYVVEESKLYPLSNLKEYIPLGRIELNSSAIIALCPLFEEVD